MSILRVVELEPRQLLSGGQFAPKPASRAPLPDAPPARVAERNTTRDANGQAGATGANWAKAFDGAPTASGAEPPGSDFAGNGCAPFADGNSGSVPSTQTEPVPGSCRTVVEVSAGHAVPTGPDWSGRSGAVLAPVPMPMTDVLGGRHSQTFVPTPPAFVVTM